MKAEIDITHQYAILPEVALHYVTAGQGDAVVLLHGWPQTWYAWRHIIPGLAECYKVIAPDLRGLGDSSKPLSGYDKKTIANDIWLLLREQLFLEQAHFVGHDWGGPTAVALAFEHPEMVRSLVLLDGPSPGDGTDHFHVGRWHHYFHWIPDLPEALVQGRENIYLNYFYRTWGARPDVMGDDDVSEYLRTYSKPGALRAGFNLYRAYYQDKDDNQKALAANGKLKMPLLVLAGGKGRGRGADLCLESARLVAEDVRGGEVPDCGHWIPEEQPEFLLRELLSFFAEK